jgi:hypothetical protein
MVTNSDNTFISDEERNWKEADVDSLKDLSRNTIGESEEIHEECQS